VCLLYADADNASFCNPSLHLRVSMVSADKSADKPATGLESAMRPTAARSAEVWKQRRGPERSERGERKGEGHEAFFASFASFVDGMPRVKDYLGQLKRAEAELAAQTPTPANGSFWLVFGADGKCRDGSVAIPRLLGSRHP